MWWMEGRGAGFLLPRLPDSHGPFSCSWLKWKGRGAALLVEWALAACRVMYWPLWEDLHMDRPRANTTCVLEVNRSSPQDHRRAMTGARAVMGGRRSVSLWALGKQLTGSDLQVEPGRQCEIRVPCRGRRVCVVDWSLCVCSFQNTWDSLGPQSDVGHKSLFRGVC